MKNAVKDMLLGMTPVSMLGLGLMTGMMLICLPPKLLPFLLGAGVLLGITVHTMLNPTILVSFVMFTSATASILTAAFDSVEAGGMSLSVSGLGWIAIAIIAIFILGFNAQRMLFPKVFLPFLLFCGWAVLRWLIAFHGSTGLKDILFYSLPPLLGIYTLFALSRSRDRLVAQVEGMFFFMVIIPAILVAILLPLGLMNHDRDSLPLLHPRAVSLYLLIPLSFSLARWCYGHDSRSKRIGCLTSVVALLTILVTLSRMASATALMLFFVASINPTKLYRTLPVACVAPVLAVLLLVQIPAYRERYFLSGEKTALTSDSWQDMNSAGRFDYMWPLTFNHAIQNPIIGWGTGSAAVLVGGLMPKPKSANYMPHNEYLNTFHDLGVIGEILLLAAWLPLWWRQWQTWKAAHLRKNALQAKWSMAATLSIGALLFTSVTDNGMHYVFVGGPLFIIVAIAIWVSDFRARTLTGDGRVGTEVSTPQVRLRARLV
ncbi:MAG: O-antigen ligase family protein [Deltaproteobacteria bacterium]|nr:O-antigen ligase family protein [Deltaproteobacteria bacterium]